MEKSEREEIVDELFQKVLLAIPNLVIYHLEWQIKNKKSVEKFYLDNPDMLKHKQILSQVVNGLQSVNPDWEIPTLFEAAVPKTKELLDRIEKAKALPKQDYNKKYQELFDSIVMGV